MGALASPVRYSHWPHHDIARLQTSRAFRQKAALLEEVEDEGGKVAVVTRWHDISESLLYNWRSAWKAAASAANAAAPVAFVPLGVVGEADGARRNR